MKIFILILCFLNCFIFSHIVLPQGSDDLGLILIKSVPGEAEVFINGENTGEKTPFQIQLDVGKYRLTLKLPEQYFHDYNGSFEILRNKTTVLEAELEPNFGDVYIESNPRGATIIIDGVNMGETPATIRGLRSGEHIVELEMENYNTLRRTFIVEDEKTTDLSLDLFAGFGTIGIVVIPRDADIYINGEHKTNGFYTGRLTAGTHEIEIKMQGYSTVKELINIDQGGEKRLQYEIEPILGSISVMIEPLESSVYVNGEFKGLSPLVINDLNIGEYEIEVRKQGYTSIRKTVEVKENQTSAVSETLFDGYNIHIISDPSSVEIYNHNDKNKIGTTPADLILPKGETTLEFRKKFYYSKLQTFNPTNNFQEFTIDLNLGHCEVNFHSNIKNTVVNLIRLDGYDETSETFTLPGRKIIPAGIYDITISRNGFRTVKEKRELDIGSFENSYILYPENYRSKGGALFRSLLWPGAGQSWLKRSGAEPLIGVIAWGTLAGGFYKSVDASRLYDEYIDSQSATDRNRLKSEYRSSQNIANTLLISAGVMWGANMIWTLMLPSEKVKYARMGWTGHFDPVSNQIQFGLIIN